MDGTNASARSFERLPLRNVSSYLRHADYELRVVAVLPDARIAGRWR
jgi:hypothetical protein